MATTVEDLEEILTEGCIVKVQGRNKEERVFTEIKDGKVHYNVGVPDDVEEVCSKIDAGEYKVISN